MADLTTIDISNVLHDVLNQMNQIKMELRAHVGDVLSQINTIRIEMRGNVSDLMTQINQVRTEMRSCVGEVRTCVSEVTNLAHATQQVHAAPKNYVGEEISVEETIQHSNAQKFPNHNASSGFQKHQMAIMEDMRAKQNSLMASQMVYMQNPSIEENAQLEESRRIHQMNEQRLQQQLMMRQNHQQQLQLQKQMSKKSESPQPSSHQKQISPEINAIQQQQAIAARRQQQAQQQEITILEEPMMEYHSDQVYETIQIGPHVEIPRSTYITFANEKRTNYLKNLLDVVFGKDVLASHTVTGKGTSNDRPALNENVVADIVKHTASKFGVEETCIKKYISDRCYNEYKRKAIEQIQQQHQGVSSSNGYMITDGV